MRVILAVLPVLVTGCINIHYKPDVTLGLSPVTIGADVRFDGIEDRSPKTDRERGMFVEVSCTEPNTLDGDLGLGLTNVVLRDFRDNQVFRKIAKRMADPDLVLEGKITRFSGKSGLNTVGVITSPFHYLLGVIIWYLDIWYIGFSIQDTWGIVELELSLRKPGGAVIGTWSARRTFEWSHSYYYSKWAIESLPGEMNRMLGEVVQEIRDQMVAEKAKLEKP